MSEGEGKKDLNEVAFNVMRQATNESKPEPEEKSEISSILENAELRKQLMREMGRKGGEKGGKARAAKLSPEERSDIAKNAARARWEK